MKTAEVLRQTFRNSDILARLGGDEFAILAQDASRHDITSIVARLEGNLRAANEQNTQPYQLSLSVGAVLIEPDNTLSLDQLIGKADKAMYVQKRSRSHSSESSRQGGLKVVEFRSRQNFPELRLA